GDVAVPGPRLRAAEEPVHLAAVPLLVNGVPRVGWISRAERGELERRVADPGGVGLRVAGRRAELSRLDLRRVPVVMIEGTVLLAGDHDVSDRAAWRAEASRPCSGRGRRPERSAGDRNAGRARLLEERAAGDCVLVRHATLPLRRLVAARLG